MSHPDHQTERIEERAHLLPEELAAGSADPELQAAAILEESDERVADPAGTQAASVQSPGPDDAADAPGADRSGKG